MSVVLQRTTPDKAEQQSLFSYLVEEQGITACSGSGIPLSAASNVLRTLHGLWIQAEPETVSNRACALFDDLLQEVDQHLYQSANLLDRYWRLAAGDELLQETFETILEALELLREQAVLLADFAPPADFLANLEQADRWLFAGRQKLKDLL